MDKTTEISQITSQAAEKYLQAKLGEPDGYWRVFLQNNRRPDRNPPHFIPFSVIKGRPHYRVADIDEFISVHRNAALGRGRVPGGLDDALKNLGGWPTGRPFAGHISPQVEEGTGVTFVQMMLANPVLIYRLDPDQARTLANELIEAANVVDRASEDNP